MTMKNLLKMHGAKIIISIIWGLGLATLFKKTCKDRNCSVYTAPDPSDITDNIYMFDKNCYIFKTELTRCRGSTVDD